jgi:hypothetical protein
MKFIKSCPEPLISEGLFCTTHLITVSTSDELNPGRNEFVPSQVSKSRRSTPSLSLMEIWAARSARLAFYQLGVPPCRLICGEKEGHYDISRTNNNIVNLPYDMVSAQQSKEE